MRRLTEAIIRLLVSMAAIGMVTERFKKHAVVATEVDKWRGRPSVEKAAAKVAAMVMEAEYERV